MYPLLLKPAVKDYLWGGTKLKTEFCLETSNDIAAEGWMLSCHKDGHSIVSNGKYEGKSLSEVISLWGDESLGERAKKYDEFPILIKLIDAKQKLSVQVHPDDEYALENEGEFGKTEMWYVVDCEENAQLIYGFTHDISKDEFAERIKNNTLTDVCNFVSVHKGDVFFIPAGTLHAIGEGMLIAEVQQNSNSTYRVSDYGRLGADGKPRELHIDKALDVTKCEKPAIPYGAVGECKNTSFGSIRTITKCNLFTAEIIALNGETTLSNNQSFLSLVCLDGCFSIAWDAEKISVKKGGSVFIPAGVNVTISGNAEILYSYV
ncbi:MAG: class I mannose-6-phosphate isomerase [Clostridia bacterium]|nr:class I mannose-6-phosphate isomerase [Clostridia bacterium]